MSKKTKHPILSEKLRTRVTWISDTQLDQSLEMMERLRMENVEVKRIDPWSINDSGAEI